MKRSIVLVSLALLSALSAACYEARGEGSRQPEDSPAAFVLSYAGVYCSALRVCPVETALYLSDLSQEVCVGLVERGEGEGVLSPALVGGLEDGSVLFQPEAVAGCLEALEASGCALLRIELASLAACREVFVGTSELGESCHASEQCVGDAYCAEADELRCGAGMCAPRLERGAPCSNNGDCSAGEGDGEAWCRYFSDTDEYRCASIPLLTSQPEGARCGAVSRDGQEAEAHCALGLNCSPDATSEALFCRAALLEGEACELFDGRSLCELGLQCLGGKCERVSILREEGAACNGEDLLCSYFMGYDCVEGRCKKGSGDGTLGAPCRGSDTSSFDCGTGLYCDPVELSCARKKQNRAACESREECESGDCDYTYRVCVARTICR